MLTQALQTQVRLFCYQVPKFLQKDYVGGLYRALIKLETQEEFTSALSGVCFHFNAQDKNVIVWTDQH